MHTDMYIYTLYTGTRVLEHWWNFKFSPYVYMCYIALWKN